MNNLINCPDCGREISIHANQCPHCGRPFAQNAYNAPTIEQKPIKKNAFLKVIVYITCVLGFFFFGMFIPLMWFIILCIACACIDGNKYDKTWYQKLRNECGIVTAIMFVFNVLALMSTGSMFLIKSDC